MSTTGITSWNVDLADISVIYPFAGWEVPMLVVGVVAWLAWHRWCHNWEKEYHDKVITEYNKRQQESSNDD